MSAYLSGLTPAEAYDLSGLSAGEAYALGRADQAHQAREFGAAGLAVPPASPLGALHQRAIVQAWDAGRAAEARSTGTSDVEARTAPLEERVADLESAQAATPSQESQDSESSGWYLAVGQNARAIGELVSRVKALEDQFAGLDSFKASATHSIKHLEDHLNAPRGFGAGFSEEKA